MKTLAEMLGFVLVGWAVTSAAAACMDAAAARAADRRARECAVCAAAVDVGPGEGHFPAWEAQLRTG